jgi:hypothetical protein
LLSALKLFDRQREEALIDAARGQAKLSPGSLPSAESHSLQRYSEILRIPNANLKRYKNRPFGFKD